MRHTIMGLFSPALVIVLCGGIPLLIPLDGYALDSAKVLPKGVSRVYVKGKFYKNISKRYDENGNAEPIAADYNARLDSSIFPALSLVDQGFGLPPGTSSIGDSDVEIDYDIQIMEVEAQHGITDRLSVGIKIPYWWVKANVDSRVDTTKATTGLNPFFGKPGDPFGGAPLVPIAFGGVPLTTEQVRSLLGPGIDLNGDGVADIPGFQYEKFESKRSDNLSDVEAGFRYQYYRDDNWRLAFTGGMRFPTGEEDDPDDLVDFASSDGTYDVLFRLNQDYMGIKNTRLNATLKYDWQLSDKKTVRVPPSQDVPLANPLAREKVDRNLGDIYGIDLSARHNINGGPFHVFTGYEYYRKEKDSINGNRELAYESLEDETNWTEHIFKIGFAYSTLRKYQAKEFGIPLEAIVVYRNRFAGSNNILKSQYLQLGLRVYF